MRRRHDSASLSLDDAQFENLGARVEVRRHPQARRLTLRVSRTQRAVIVTLPSQCEINEANSFVERHIDWVRERLGSIPEPVPLVNRALMPLRGIPHRVVFCGRRTGTGLVTPVEGPDYRELHVSGPLEQAPKRFRQWLFDEARRDLDKSVIIHAKRLGLKPKRIAVRDQKSRWGSCSSTGSLSFSWRLIMAPPFVLDYVAAHEVAHLREMNHGPRFWKLVAQSMPRMDEAKNWLQVYGMDLHRYGAEPDDLRT
ncbi:conserved protein of unknown function [Candidatus Filomicrobium marinum]|uniref:YgjP-like metallopeptidase domain-containing protein n=2 Tax=Filomicrobium TaxID=119044 RepID=A0A0D6JE08_9HYPH|nr:MULTISPECIES: SprT family zinc-dependent metalloprotease [Filomicrobium]MCV0368279.1 M48 family metallopeptidase [Filomicrobium sp.]CFX13008.1 conserved protein of unknown function [Candidatus Filomicrobium marinum]CPR17541.1 conserved protein of unknown function [Candidatus Filomicrobium marinum]SDO32297.1 hypothetical protein SAMN04488061_0890 [Filomicrobium insigne]